MDVESIWYGCENNMEMKWIWMKLYITREGYCCFVKILEEYKLECKYFYKMIKILLLLAIIMVLKLVLEVILVLGTIIKHKYVSASSYCTKECRKSRYILAEDFTCKDAASGNISTFSVSGWGEMSGLG